MLVGSFVRVIYSVGDIVLDKRTRDFIMVIFLFCQLLENVNVIKRVIRVLKVKRLREDFRNYILCIMGMVDGEVIFNIVGFCLYKRYGIYFGYIGKLLNSGLLKF